MEHQRCLSAVYSQLSSQGDPFDPFAVPRTGGGSNRNFIDDGRSIRELTPDFVLCTIIDVGYGRADLPMTIASDTRRPASLRSFWLGMAAYLAPTFPIAFIWHLVLFEPNYHALQIYRADPIIPFGLFSSRNPLYRLAVPDRGTSHCPSVSKLTRRTDETIFQG